MVASVCVSIAEALEVEQPVTAAEFWTTCILILVLVIGGGIVAGLTIGLMSLDETNLAILKMSGTATEKLYAARIEPIRKDSHLLLVTLLLTNTVFNETLPILFDKLRLTGWQAIVSSTILIVIFGEIIPQAVCARYGLQIGAFFAWPVRILIAIEWVIAYPIAKLLDYILGHRNGLIYRRAELKELVALHGEDQAGPLTRDEVSVLRAVLELRDKTVQNIMTSLQDVFMLPLSSTLDLPTIQAIIQAGHSRVPIHMDGDRDKVIGVVLVKQLIVYDPDDATPMASVKIRRLPRVAACTPLFDMLHVFEQGGSHMALVVQEPHGSLLPPDSQVQSPRTSEEASPSPASLDDRSSSIDSCLKHKTLRSIGIVTLEDVIEELLGEEIIDETDVYVDMASKVKVARALRDANSVGLADKTPFIYSPGLRAINSILTYPHTDETDDASEAERQPLLANHNTKVSPYLQAKSTLNAPKPPLEKQPTQISPFMKALVANTDKTKPVTVGFADRLAQRPKKKKENSLIKANELASNLADEQGDIYIASRSRPHRRRSGSDGNVVYADLAIKTRRGSIQYESSAAGDNSTEAEVSENGDDFSIGRSVIDIDKPFHDHRDERH